MRRLLSFEAAGAELAASLDSTGGTTGLVLVTGGSQTRIGSHRMYERLAKALSENSFPCFRFDRRGVGDSPGEDPGFRGGEADLRAAVAAFRRELPALERVMGLGLCDGATALALFGKAAGIDALILVNPWLVEAEADAPAPAAIRAHYRKRLLSRDGWKKLLSGRVDYRKLLGGILKISAKRERAPLAREAAAALRASGLRAWLILAEGDGTAIAAVEELKAPAFAGLIEGREIVKSDSHTFARPGDEAALLQATVRAIEALSR
ncbi:MAG TPA: hydrolase 1, exosortase A system-associated [Allosphingosinicella sp.]|nr:hydrolase 1, exosortase A system-associated [Allosphingosinicella sp.]